MGNLLLEHLADGGIVLADGYLSAAQIEVYLANQRRCAATAWPSQRVVSIDAWTEALWKAYGDERSLLTSAQARAVWRETVAASPHSAAIVHAAQIANSARSAWELLQRWAIDPGLLRPRSGEVTFALFVDWAQAVAIRMQESGWIDRSQLAVALGRAVEHSQWQSRGILLADCRQRWPAFEQLIGALQLAGESVEHWEPREDSCQAWRRAFAERADEIAAAVAWSWERLERRPDSRIAIVIAPRDDEGGLTGLADSVGARGGRTREHRLTPLDGAPITSDPLIGAACDLLALLGRNNDFATLSRVLRSGFFGGNEVDWQAAAMLESRLRGEISAQADFRSAYFFGGLASRLETAVPTLASRLAATLARVEKLPRKQSAVAWSRFMNEALTELGWPGGDGNVPADTLDLWSRISSELAELTPVLGAIDLDRALRELETIIEHMRRMPALPLAGISLFSSLEQIGPGYDAAWVTGMTDQAWPGATRPHALIPLGLQLTHRMPNASPVATLECCRAATSAVIARVPEIIFSYPCNVDDQPAAPSPLIRDLPTLVQRLEPPRSPYRAIGATQIFELESIDDPVPPLVADSLSGGAAALASQARCPLRAFIEYRLGAAALERPQRGISPRLRGILTHRALENFYRGIDSRGALLELAEDERDARIDASVERALKERVTTVGPFQHALRAMERARLVRLLQQFVAIDCGRGGFRIEALEVRARAMISGLGVECRIDRIDRLDDGRLAIIDYKTGRAASPQRWLAPRFSEPQLPLYSLAVTGQVAALMLAVLRPEDVGFKGFSDAEGAFAGRRVTFAWEQQLATWRGQLAALVDEIIAGDGRVFEDALEDVSGSFAPLSRICDRTRLSPDLTRRVTR